MNQVERWSAAADLVDDVATACGIRFSSWQRTRAEAAIAERLDRLYVKWIARADQARVREVERVKETGG
jgi:hypothetical protein